MNTLSTTQVLTRRKAMLNNNEIYAKMYMFKVFIPSLHKLLQDKNPKEYEKWGGNCCRQSAIFGAYILNELLPEYEWTVWDGEMDDIVNGKEVSYNHAWILGKGNGKRLLVDLARSYRERLFIEVKSNGYPKDHPEYIHMVVKSRTKIDWESEIKNEREYYTGYTGKEFYEKLLEVSKPYAVSLMLELKKRTH